MFMHQFHSKNIPSIFSVLFQYTRLVHSYNTRLAFKSSLFISQNRTNYGKFNIRYKGPKIWNSMDKHSKNRNPIAFKLTN